jgi:SAM-dependent methyltransferase
MVLVGEEHPHYALRPLIDELGLGDSVRILGYVPLDIFDICIAACDVCINLRRPTAGETSGSFLRALALGKPALVSEIGAFIELPDDIAVKIPVDDREEDWVFEYLRALAEDRPLAEAIGARAQQYAHRECAWPKVAAEYVKFLAEFAPRESTRATPAKVSLPENGSAAASHKLAQTASEIENYIFGFCRSSPLMEEYALTHRKRLVRTIQLTPRAGLGERVLELGCYMQLTPALEKLGYGEVRGAYYGPLGEKQRRSAASAAGEVFGCEIDLFDAERDRFPYPDSYFNTVLCCELIEHLPNDPMHMVTEINRVLAGGGYFLLSTPNIASYRGVHAILHGYHPGLFPAYIKPSQDGTVDPRHSREYTPREVAVLMQAGGFHVEYLETGEYGADDEHAAWTDEFLRRNQCSAELRGAVIYCLGKKTGPVQDRWPKDLYYPP